MEGNQMKMREALVKIRDIIMGGGFDGRSPAHIVNICDAALSEPPRQCDVGTAEEQSDRFASLCDSYSGCSQCPVKSRWNFANGHKPSCGVLFAHAPYKAEEGAGE